MAHERHPTPHEQVPGQQKLDLGLEYKHNLHLENQELPEYSEAYSDSLKRQLGEAALEGYLQSLDSDIAGKILEVKATEKRFDPDFKNRIDHVIKTARLSAQREILWNIMHHIDEYQNTE